MRDDPKEVKNYLGHLRDLRTRGDELGLIAALSNPLEAQGVSIRGDAAAHLGYLGSEEAVPDIARLLTDDNQLARLQAAGALGRIGSPSAVPALLEILDDDDREVRGQAIASLGLIRDPRVVPELISALDPPPRSWTDRSTVLCALLLVDDPRASAKAEEQLRRERPWRRRAVRRFVDRQRLRREQRSWK
jgi:HEAT repeat protein